MRVLLISHSCATRTEGQPKAELLGRMSGVDLRVVIPHRWNHYGRDDRPGELPPDGASFECDMKKVWFRWFKPVGWHLHWYPDLGTTIREFRPDVIDLWEEPWGVVSAHTVWLRNRHCPHARIVTETEQNIYKDLPFPFERFRSYTLRNADYAVARNEEAASVLRRKGFTRPVEVVPNAVDADLFHPLADDQRELARRELGFEGFVAGYIGRLVPEKGLTDMIDALSHCPPSVKVMFLGSGPMREELERRAEEAGVSKRVMFLAARPLQELPKVMSAMDALVLPSRTTPQWKEQFGRVIIEAHACRTPVVGSDSGAIPSVVGQGGAIFPEASFRELAATLTRLNADPAEARRLGAVGREQVERLYTWGRVAERMASIYSKVAGNGPVAVDTRIVAERPSIAHDMAIAK
jgi:glycosyltransferase involved in cell wall biosynthesis